MLCVMIDSTPVLSRCVCVHIMFIKKGQSKENTVLRFEQDSCMPCCHTKNKIEGFWI
ncbi:hypothetical protein AAZX31_02G126800 [Glycine max]